MKGKVLDIIREMELSIKAIHTKCLMVLYTLGRLTVKPV